MKFDGLTDQDSIINEIQDGIEFRKTEKQVTINVIKEGVSPALDEQERKIREKAFFFGKKVV